MENRTVSWKRTFFTIWGGQAVSLLTSAIVQMAIIWYLTFQTGSALILSLATLVGFLPQGLLGIFIGVYIDRYDRRRIMIAADVFIAAAGLVLMLTASFGDLPVWLVLAVLFVRSIGTAFHTPAMAAVTPLIVPEDKLVKCAGYSQTLQSVSYLAGPALASLLYTTWSLNWILLLDAAGAAVAVGMLLAVKIPAAPKAGAEKPHMWREAKEGIQALRAHKGLMALVVIGAVYMFIYMPVNALFPLVSIAWFGGTAWHAGLVEVAFAAGMLLGGITLGIWGGFKNRSLTIVASMLLMGLSLAVSGLLPLDGFAVFASLCAAMGLSAPFFSGVSSALFQSKIAPEYLGRVFSLSGSMAMLAMPLGLALSGALADYIGVNIWFLLSGIAVLTVGAVCLLLPGVRAAGR